MAEREDSFVAVERVGSAVRLVLDRPGRGNALVPELLRDLRGAIERASTLHPPALILTGRGRAFSAGGDVSAFADAAGDPARLQAFSSEIVGELNGAILDLLAFPAPVHRDGPELQDRQHLGPGERTSHSRSRTAVAPG